MSNADKGPIVVTRGVASAAHRAARHGRTGEVLGEVLSLIDDPRWTVDHVRLAAGQRRTGTVTRTSACSCSRGAWSSEDRSCSRRGLRADRAGRRDDARARRADERGAAPRARHRPGRRDDVRLITTFDRNSARASAPSRTGTDRCCRHSAWHTPVSRGANRERTALATRARGWRPPGGLAADTPVGH
jgi:hypothetical protein